MSILKQSQSLVQLGKQRALLPFPATFAQVQQTRSAHKLVEIELQEDVLALGRQGDRLPVAPGRARTLFAARRALYVVKGRPVSPLRDIILKQASLEERERLLRSKFRSANAAASSSSSQPLDPHAAARKADLDLQSAILLVPSPLVFPRKLLHATEQGAQAPSGSEIFGSVSSNDVHKALRSFGIEFKESNGAFVEAEGVEKGKIKTTGEFSFTIQLKALEKSVDVFVNVVQEA
ncbi:hypothetical protein T439DRAFT_377344 [Meredithblackwellia eburnea MCA 4105]